MKLKQLWTLALSSNDGINRFFAFGQLICFPVSLLTLSLLIWTAILKSLNVSMPGWWTRILLPILCAAAIGYLTNYIAVRMLFEPYRSENFHWLRLLTCGLWKQGLIPTRKPELAEAVGKEISKNLLTPEVITEEIRKLVGAALDDQEFRENLKYTLGPILRQNLPSIVDRFTPEIMSLLREGLSGALTCGNPASFFDKVVDPCLQSTDNQSRLVDAIVNILRKEIPKIVEVLQTASKKYKEKDLFKKVLVSAAEWLKVLDWLEVQRTLEDQIGKSENRLYIANLLIQTSSELKEKINRGDTEWLIEQFKIRASDFIGNFIQRFLSEKLPETMNRLLDTPSFWRWLAADALPTMKPHIMSWFEKEGNDFIGRRFDVAGRVRSAVDQMDIKAVHMMVDNVSNEQLGAIQVLGYVLGLAVGIPLVMLL